MFTLEKEYANDLCYYHIQCDIKVRDLMMYLPRGREIRYGDLEVTSDAPANTWKTSFQTGYPLDLSQSVLDATIEQIHGTNFGYGCANFYIRVRHVDKLPAAHFPL